MADLCPRDSTKLSYSLGTGQWSCSKCHGHIVSGKTIAKISELNNFVSKLSPNPLPRAISCPACTQSMSVAYRLTCLLLIAISGWIYWSTIGFDHEYRQQGLQRVSGPAGYAFSSMIVSTVCLLAPVRMMRYIGAIIAALLMGGVIWWARF